MAPTKRKQAQTHKQIAFWLRKNIYQRLEEYCEKYDAKVSDFMRDAVLEKLNRPVDEDRMLADYKQIHEIMLTVQSTQKSLIDLQQQFISLEEENKELQSKISTIEGPMDDYTQLLLEHKPKNYKEVSELISDPEKIQEVMTQLMTLGKVRMNKKRGFEWQ